MTQVSLSSHLAETTLGGNDNGKLCDEQSLMTYLAGFDVVNPACDFSLLDDQRVGFHEFDFFLDSLIKVREFQELYGISRSRNLRSVSLLCGSLELLSKLRGRECLHPTIGMVEYGDFTGPQQPLGDDQRPDRIFPASDG